MAVFALLGTFLITPAMALSTNLLLVVSALVAYDQLGLGSHWVESASLRFVDEQRGGGEEVFLRDLAAHPPPDLHYRLALHHHERLPGAQARSWEERLYNRLIHPLLHPLPVLRSYQVTHLPASQLTRQEVTVALTGDGGDEVFAGYDRSRGALLAETVPRWISAWGNAVGRHPP